jgi:hypothetical protein
MISYKPAPPKKIPYWGVVLHIVDVRAAQHYVLEASLELHQVLLRIAPSADPEFSSSFWIFHILCSVSEALTARVDTDRIPPEASPLCTSCIFFEEAQSGVVQLAWGPRL